MIATHEAYAAPETCSPESYKACRRAMKMSETALAEALGVSRATIQRRENGQAELSNESIIAMAMLWQEHCLKKILKSLPETFSREDLLVALSGLPVVRIVFDMLDQPEACSCCNHAPVESLTQAHTRPAASGA